MRISYAVRHPVAVHAEVDKPKSKGKPATAAKVKVRWYLAKGSHLLLLPMPAPTQLLQFQQAEPEGDEKPIKAAKAKGKGKRPAAARDEPANGGVHAAGKDRSKAEGGKEPKEKKARKWLWPWQKRDTPLEVRLAQQLESFPW